MIYKISQGIDTAGNEVSNYYCDCKICQETTGHCQGFLEFLHNKKSQNVVHIRSPRIIKKPHEGRDE